MLMRNHLLRQIPSREVIQTISCSQITLAWLLARLEDSRSKGRATCHWSWNGLAELAVSISASQGITRHFVIRRAVLIEYTHESGAVC